LEVLVLHGMRAGHRLVRGSPRKLRQT
jgi:hypothetical protein